MEEPDERDFQEQLEERLNAENPGGGWARHLALVIMALTGMAVYAGWRVKHREAEVSGGKAVTAANFNLENRSRSFLPEKTVPDLPAVAPLPELPEMPARAENPSNDLTMALTPAEKTPDEAFLGARALPEAPKPEAAEAVVIPEEGETLPDAPLPESLTALRENTARAVPPAPTPPTAAAPAVRIHVITEDDSLPQIAQKYYGSASVENIIRLRQANPALKNGGFRPGVRLMIPDAGTAAQTPRPAAQAAARAPQTPAEMAPAGGSYTVRPGETLSRIAAKLYGRPAAWKEIHALNRDLLPTPDALKAGMTLRLPSIPAEEND